jgi:hypothetical protein
VVEHLTHHCKVNGSSLATATGTGGKKMVVKHCCQMLTYYSLAEALIAHRYFSKSKL